VDAVVNNKIQRRKLWKKLAFLDNGNYLIPAVTTVPEGNGPF